MAVAEDLEVKQTSPGPPPRDKSYALLLAWAALLCAAPLLPRSVRFVELPAVLLLPGYALVLILFRKRRSELGPTGLLLLSFFLSTSVAIAACLVLYVSGIKLDARSCGPTIGAVTIILLGLSWAGRHRGDQPLARLEATPRPKPRQVLVGCGCVGLTVAAMAGVIAITSPPREPGYVAVSLSRPGGQLGAVEDMAPGTLRLTVVVQTDHLPPTTGALTVGLVGRTALPLSVAVDGHSTQVFPVSVAVPAVQGCDHRVLVTLRLDGRTYDVTQYVATRRARC